MAESKLWHGFTDMSVVRGTDPFILVQGVGPYLFDAQGRRYLDGSAGLWFCNVGHGRREIADAVHHQLSKLAAYSTFGDYTNEPAERLARRLVELSPTQGGVVFFTSGGSDSIDSAIKLVRRFWLALGFDKRRTIVSRRHAFHGGHVGGTGIGGIEADREGFDELVPSTARVDWDSVEDLERVVGELGPETIAAFVVEPVMAAGGVRFAPEGYLSAVTELCRAHDIVLIADEVVTGFGRCGDWFASRRFGLEPDIVVTAKGLTSGYMPLGALIVSDKVAAPFYEGDAGPFLHGYSYSGHPAATAASLVNLEILDREGLADNVLALEPVLPELMSPIADHPAVQEVRTGPALMAAIEFKPDVLALRPQVPAAVATAMRGAGVLTRALVGGQIQFSPPLVVGPEHVTEFVDAALEGLSSISV
jgi:putrescine---pyruvate transaminase